MLLWAIRTDDLKLFNSILSLIPLEDTIPGKIIFYRDLLQKILPHQDVIDVKGKGIRAFYSFICELYKNDKINKEGTIEIFKNHFSKNNKCNELIKHLFRYTYFARKEEQLDHVKIPHNRHLLSPIDRVFNKAYNQRLLEPLKNLPWV